MTDNKNPSKDLITSLIVIIVYLFWSTFIQIPLSVLNVQNKFMTSIYEIILCVLIIIFIMLIFNMFIYFRTEGITITNNTLNLQLFKEFALKLTLKDYLNKKRYSVIFSSILIGIFYLIYNHISLSFIPYYLVGLFLSINYIKTDNIIINILSRIIYNLLLLVMVVT